LYSIAEAFDMTVDEIVEINGLSSNVIEAYSPIRLKKIQGEVDANLVYKASDSIRGMQKYIVQAGETVMTVAKKFNMPEELLMELNGLTSHHLDEGTELDILIQ